MTLPALAPVSDLANLIEDFDADVDRGRAALRLRQASSLVRLAAGQDFMTDDDPPVLATVPEPAWTITLEAAKRAMENPKGLNSFTIDDYTERPGDAAIAGVYLTEGELAILGLLKPAGATSFGGIGTLTTTRDDLDPLLDTTWARVSGQPDDQLFPLYPADGPLGWL